MRHRVPGAVIATMAYVLLGVAGAGGANAQEPAAKPATGSIAGVVMKDGEPAPGVGVILVERDERGWGAGDTVLRARTDREGKFSFEGLKQASYVLDAFLPGAFVRDDSPWDGAATVTLGDGEAVTGVTLELTLGGVMTGKLTDADGRPVAGEPIHVFVEKPGAGGSSILVSVSGQVESDDRGVYRVYGLSPGRYTVAAGLLSDRNSTWYGRRTPYELAYYGGGSTPDGAKRVVVEPGTEARGVDLVVSRGTDGFRIAGKVVDAETREPVTGIWIGCGLVRDGRSPRSENGTGVRDDGSFFLEGLEAGTYRITGTPGGRESAPYFCDPVQVTITDRDLRNVTVEMRRGGSISGVIVPIEAAPDIDVRRLRESAIVFRPVIDPSDPPAQDGMMFGQPVVKPDMTYTVGGLRAGSYVPEVSQYCPVRGYFVARVDVDGAPVPGPIRVTGSEEIRGVRIAIGRTTAVVRGRVVLTNGSVPAKQVFIHIKRSDSTPALYWFRVDSAFAFLVDSMPPGEYVAIATAIPSGGTSVKSKPVPVSVGTEGTVDVTIEIDLATSPEGGGEKP